MQTLEVSTRRERNQRIADLFQQGRYLDALPLALEACSGDPPAAPDLDRAESLEHLGNLYRELGDYAQAEPPLLQALSDPCRGAGQGAPAYARTLNDLALLYEELAQYTQAEPLFRKALAIRKKSLGEEHPEVAESLHDLGDLHDMLARYGEADVLHRQARDSSAASR